MDSTILVRHLFPNNICSSVSHTHIALLAGSCLPYLFCLYLVKQQMDTSAEGQTYIQRYQVQDYPHIGFIDPRTGRLMWRKEGWTQESPMSTEIFAEVAMDFCSRNSFDRPPQAPRPSSSSRPAKRERPMHEMSEDEQLQAAMRASMGDLPVESTAHDDSTDDVEFLGTGDDDDHKPAAKVVAPPAAAAAVEKLVKEPSLNDELVQMNIADEPAKGARLQFKTPDGKRVVRRFDPSDAVKTIYAFVAVSLRCVHALCIVLWYCGIMVGRGLRRLQRQQLPLYIFDCLDL